MSAADPAASTDTPTPDEAAPARVRTRQETLGDDAVRTATGRTSAEWFAALDEAGAAAWPHGRIVTWLRTEADVPSWWAQSVTVAYEQARGRRAPGQQPDGTFEASVSKVVHARPATVLDLLTRREPLEEWLGEVPHALATTAAATVRWEWPDGTRVTVVVREVGSGRVAGPDAAKVSVVATASRLPDADAAALAKKHWRERLARLATAASDA